MRGQFNRLYKYVCLLHTLLGRLVWPSGKALGWEAEGPWLDSASALLSLQKGCGLWTLHCDFVKFVKKINLKMRL